MFSLCVCVFLTFYLSFPPFIHGPCYRRSITDISSHPTLSRRPEPSSSFLKLENFRGEKKHHVSAALGKKPPSFLASFPGAFSAGIRALFCHDYLHQIVFLLWSSRVGIYSLCCILFASKGTERRCHKITNNRIISFLQF